MKRPTREQQAAIVNLIHGKRSTESYLQENILTVQRACINNQVLHLSQHFVDSPGQSGVVVCYVTCPDEVAIEIHEAIDRTVKEILNDHDLTFVGSEKPV